MSNWTIDLRDCTVADFDISPGISAGRCSTFRHLTYITLNMSAHINTHVLYTHTQMHTHTHQAGGAGTWRHDLWASSKYFNGGVVDFSSPPPPPCTNHILYIQTHTLTHTDPHTRSHSCTAVRVGGALPFWWETEREREGEGRLGYCDWAQRESHRTVDRALSLHALWATLCHGSVCAVSLTPDWRP